MLPSLVLACWLALFGAAGSDMLTGTVRDPSGAVVAGALVTLRASPAFEVSVRTAADGRFAADAPPGALALTVTAAGFTEYRVTLRPGERDVQVVLALGRLASEVTVTAGRIEQPVADVPAHVSIVTRETIERSPAMSIDDVLRQTPAFSLFRRSSSIAAHPTAQGVSLRGIGPSGVSRTLVLLDGVPMNDPFGGWISWSRVPAGLIEQVEIVEGSGANLFGSSTLGGAINLVTAPPARSTLAATAQYAERGTPRLGVTGGWRRGALGIVADGAWFRTRGYPVVRPEERGAVDTKVSLEFANTSAAAHYTVNDRAVAFVRGGYLDESRDNGKHSTIDGTPESNHTGWLSASTGLRATTDGGSALQVSLSVDRVRFRSNFLAVPASTPPRSIGRMTLKQTVPSIGTVASAQWSRTILRRHLVTAGTDWRFVDGDSREELLDTQTGTRVTGQRIAGGTQRTWGLFAQDVVTLIPRATLTLALRHDRWSNRDGHNLETDAAGLPTADNRPALPDRTDHVTNPRAALNLRATEWLTLWGGAGFAFRAPTLNELYRPFRVGTVTTLANHTLDAERLRTGEGGVRISAGRDLSLRATWFHNSLEDAISNVTIATAGTSVTQQRQNLGRTRIRGVEAGVDWRPSPHVTFSAAYLHNDATVVAAAQNPALVGKTLAQVPRHRGSVQAAFRHPKAGRIAVSLLAAGRQYDDDLNVRAVPGASAPGLPAYSVVDLLVSRPVGRGIELFAGAQNLLDRAYVAGTLPTTLAAPRSVSAGIRWQMRRAGR